MATALQRSGLRFDLDFCAADLGNDLIDELYARVELVYPTNAAAADAQVRVTVIDHLIAGASKLVDYTQNESSEKLSQIIDNLLKWRAIYAGNLDAAINATLPSVMWGALRRVTPHYVEFPNNYSVTLVTGDLSRFEGGATWLP